MRSCDNNVACYCLKCKTLEYDMYCRFLGIYWFICLHHSLCTSYLIKNAFFFCIFAFPCSIFLCNNQKFARKICGWKLGYCECKENWVILLYYSLFSSLKEAWIWYFQRGLVLTQKLFGIHKFHLNAERAKCMKSKEAIKENLSPPTVTWT